MEIHSHRTDHERSEAAVVLGDMETEQMCFKVGFKREQRIKRGESSRGCTEELWGVQLRRAAEFEELRPAGGELQ